jgi:hypothetical protein
MPTKNYGYRRISLAWLLLVGATALSWEFGHGVGFDNVHIASAFVIAVAFIKVRIVFFEFMELRDAPLGMRIAANVWTVVVCAVLIVLYLAAYQS